MHEIQNKGQARLFRQEQLEFLTKTHPLVIWSLYLPVIVYLPWRTSSQTPMLTSSVVMLFLSGMFFWTLAEYLLHRFLFHAHAETKLGKRFLYLLHGNHHHFPRDRQRLFMPPVPGMLLASLWASFLCLVGNSFISFFQWIFTRLSVVWYYALCHSLH